MTRKRVLIGALCLGLLAMGNICNAQSTGLDFDAHLFSWPTFFGKFAPQAQAPATTPPPFDSPFVAAGSDLVNLKLVAVGGNRLGENTIGLSINNATPDIVWNDRASIPKTLNGVLSLNFPCKAGSPECGTFDPDSGIGSTPSGEVGIIATYPLVAKDGYHASDLRGFGETVVFSTSGVTAPVLDLADPASEGGAGRVIYTQNEKSLSTIKFKALPGDNFKPFTLKFGKISVFFDDSGAIDSVKGIQANYTLVDSTGAIVDQGKAFFNVQ